MVNIPPRRKRGGDLRLEVVYLLVAVRLISNKDNDHRSLVAIALDFERNFRDLNLSDFVRGVVEADSHQSKQKRGKR